MGGESTPNLPAADIVGRVLLDSPSIQAAASQIRVEEANRTRLEAGQYEWNIRLGGQQRRSNQTPGIEERYKQWNLAIERPLRLPGKSSLDNELGATGVTQAETAHGDALHENSRGLLKSWFTWLKENAAAEQWAKQVASLEKQGKSVRRRQQLGDASRLESIQAEAALAQAQAQLTHAKARLQGAGEDLRRRYPGLPLPAPGEIAAPVPIEGTEADWVNAILEHSHELELARGDTRHAQILAGRSSHDRIPDPSIGLHVSQERAGEGTIVGAYISIPLSGDARRAASDAALAQATATSYREAATRQKIAAESAVLYHSASAAFAAWQTSRTAAEQLGRAAEMTARAYQLGEGTLNDLLAANRLANEAALSMHLGQLEALELRYRLLLDTHRLWAFDEEKQAGN